MIRAAKNATKTSLVMVGTGSDPVQAGLVDSLARPGGNVTGLTNLNVELGGKRSCSRKRVPSLPVLRFSTILAFQARHAR